MSGPDLCEHGNDGSQPCAECAATDSHAPAAPAPPTEQDAVRLVHRMAGWRCASLHGHHVTDPCERCQRMAEDAISLITRVRAARGVAGSGPDDEQEAAATKEGVNAARDGWVDGMEFDDAVSMGIGVAFGLSRPRAVQAEHHPRAEEVEAAARALWKMGNARIGETPAAPRPDNLLDEDELDGCCMHGD